MRSRDEQGDMMVFRKSTLSSSAAAVTAILLLGATLGQCAAVTPFGLVDPPVEGYRGSIPENLPAGSTVQLSGGSAIRTDRDSELLCRVDVVRHHGEIRVPFEVVLTDQAGGLAELRTTERLDYEGQNFYSFQIEAISCSGTYAERAYVLVQVEDENEFAPTWQSDSIKVSVMEGSSVSSALTTLSASDADGSREMGDVCEYRIESPEQPFRISEQGELFALHPLNYSSSHSYVLSILASDCAGKTSDAPVIVVVEVRQRCKRRWNGISSVANYIPGTGPLPLYPEAQLEMCEGDRARDLEGEEAECEVDNIRTTVDLETTHIGKGCDRETYSLFSQRRLCGASEESVDMLPEEEGDSPVDPHVLRDRGHSSDASITYFDGVSGLSAPEEVQRMHNQFPGDKFTLSTWMRHRGGGAGGGEGEGSVTDKHDKEHVVCRADDHKKNRHHMALFIRNCKLVLLLRQEYKEGEENVFRPAEWRWKLPQVCDDEWHHYALNVDFPEVQLIIDGDRWISEKDNPEVIDDWPLRQMPSLSTRVTIGACWQGSENTFRHQLRGYLAGFSFVRGANENEEVLRCLQECAEELKVPAASAVAPGLEMLANARGSRVVVDGPAKQAEGVRDLVRQVAYLNTREFPAPGQRLLKLSTSVTCSDGRTLALEDRRSTVSVVPMQEPKIEISGTDNIDREYEDFKLGVRIFADVRIVMTTGGSGSGDGNGGEPVNGIENRLDSCSVSVSPPLNADHETFEVPEDLLRSLKVSGDVDASGATFKGAEMIYNYERLLRQVTYTNKKPAYYLNRQFKIVCSELNGRFVSNEYSQTLTVVHPKTNEDEDEDASMRASATVTAARFQQPGHAFRSLDEQSVEEVNFKQFAADRTAGVAHNNVVAMVAVVFVAFLAVLLILGIVRVRATHQRGGGAGGGDGEDEEEAAGSGGQGQDAAEMQWDDSALNITVNPMEESGAPKSAQPSTGGLAMEDEEEEEEDEEDSLYGEDEEGEMYEEEEDEEEEEDQLVVVRPQHPRNGPDSRRNLEWDNQDL